MIKISICLDDIPEAKVFKSEKSQKSYVDIIINKRKETDKFGNTHTVYLSQTKDEKESGKEKIYVGNAKEIEFK
jgi:hypothetical protein